MIAKSVLTAVVILGGMLATPVLANTLDEVDVYQIGATGSPALDPGGTSIGGAPTISWTHNVSDLTGPFTLSIVAEGIDTGESDGVYVNNNFVGYLTQQGFYSGAFNLNPGPGALPGITALTTSVFDVTAWIVLGLNDIRVVVDPNNWVNEIETSTLSAVPIPGALPLLVTGLAGVGYIARRKARAA